MKIIKRNGSEVDFDLNKIVVAVTKANAACEKQELTASQIQEIAEYVEFKTVKANRALSVEEIQDIVEDQIMAQGAFEVARRYVRYRYTRSLIRKANTTDNQILSLIECNNEEVKQENSNKNPTVNSVQRDYMAGEVSKDITKRILLPQDIVEAHEAGIIHFHDSDYFAQHMHNCDLVNLEDMLQNGTVISGTMIEKPHSFSTACNIATQIIAQVASSQYGGQSISLAHLAPFVQISREKIRASVQKEAEAFGATADQEQINKIAEERLRDEIRRGVQTIQYQVVTLLTSKNLPDGHWLSGQPPSPDEIPHLISEKWFRSGRHVLPVTGPYRRQPGCRHQSPSGWLQRHSSRHHLLHRIPIHRISSLCSSLSPSGRKWKFLLPDISAGRRRSILQAE